MAAAHDKPHARCPYTLRPARDDFRHFRTVRVRAAEISQQRYPGSRVKLLAKWRGTLDEGRAV